jgi:hypothetical protein
MAVCFTIGASWPFSVGFQVNGSMGYHNKLIPTIDLVSFIIIISYSELLLTEHILS